MNKIKNYLTHREIETLCDDVLIGQGWIRQTAVVYAPSQKWKPFIPILPDRIYRKGEDYLVLEIKPGNCSTDELRRGLGQMISYLPYRVKAYLVISEEQWYQFKALMKYLPWLGVLVYAQTRREIKKLWVAQKMTTHIGTHFFPVTFEDRDAIKEDIKRRRQFGATHIPYQDLRTVK